MIMRRPYSCTATRRDHPAEDARNAQVTAEQVKKQAKAVFCDDAVSGCCSGCAVAGTSFKRLCA